MGRFRWVTLDRYGWVSMGRYIHRDGCADGKQKKTATNCGSTYRSFVSSLFCRAGAHDTLPRNFMKSPPSNAERLNAYRLMWILVFFDLPTYTSEDRKIASGFRKDLLHEGFTMFQFSIYTRPCPSRENVEVHTRRLERLLPPRGKVGIMPVTDKQFGLMKLYYGTVSAPKPEGYVQLMLF